MDLHSDHTIRDSEEEQAASVLRTCCDTDFEPQPRGAQNGYEYRARSSSRGRGRYFGVGPGVELPTRMHYFEGALKHDNVANATPGRGLRRVPVVNFDLLRAGNTFGNGYPTGISTSELEKHLFDARPRPRIGHTAHHFSQYDEYRAAGGSEARSAEGHVCSYDTVVSKQVAVGLQAGPSVDHHLHQGQTCVLDSSPGNEAQAVDGAHTQQGGPIPAEHGLEGTAEENAQGPDAWSECAQEANEGESETGQEEGLSIISNSSDGVIVFTPRSSALGSEFGASANGESDIADAGDNVHFTDSRGWHDD